MGTHNEIARQVAQQATAGGVQTLAEERDIPYKDKDTQTWRPDHQDNRSNPS